jgi:hypothetical protein
MEASISSSVSLRSFSRSLLILRGALRETSVILFSFIATCSPRSNDPTDVASKRAYKGNFYVLQKSEYQIAFLALSVGPEHGNRSLKENPCVFEGDVAVAKNLVALLWSPIESAHLREQLRKFFGHFVRSLKKQ